MDKHKVYNVELFDLAHKVNATSVYITSTDGKPIKLIYEDCEYCKKSNTDEMPPEIPKEELDTDSLRAYVYFNGDLDIWDFEEGKQDTFLINYCPMCGRRLRRSDKA